MFNKSSKEIYDKLLSKTLALAAIIETGDSSVKRIMSRDYNPVVEPSWFSNGQGLMSDGKVVKIHEYDRRSFNILTNMVISGTKRGEITKASTKFYNDRESIIVYVNGLKVPDGEVYLYCTDYHTNVIIPESFFDRSGDNYDHINHILIENRVYSNYTYGGWSGNLMGGSSVTFNTPSNRNIVANQDTTFVYCDGVYINSKVTSIVQSQDTTRITFSIPITGLVEVFCDDKVHLRNVYNISGGRRLPLIIPESFIDPVHGPINNNNCVFFKNGIRIYNSEVDQIGRLNFEFITDEPLDNEEITVIYGDAGLIKDTRYRLYGDDYYLYNFLGTDKMADALSNGQVGNDFIFDGKVNYREILDRQYDYQDTLDLIDELKGESNIDTRIYKLLDKRKLLIRDFLEEFTIKPMEYHIDYQGTTDVYVGTDRVYKEGTKILRIVSVNGKVIAVQMIDTSLVIEYYKVTIPGIHFSTGENTVIVTEIPSFQEDESKYKIIRARRYVDTFGNLSYRVELDVFSNIETVDDLKLMAVTSKEYDPDGIYMNDSDFGFKIVEYPTIVMDGKISIDFGSIDPRLDSVVVVPIRHHDAYSITIDDYEHNLYNELYVGTIEYFHNNSTQLVKIPLIHVGDFYIVDTANRRRLYAGSDFMYRSPLTHADLRSSGIILRQKLPTGARIEIGLAPIYTKSFKYPNVYIEDTGDNKYGLIYIGNLRFPFSNEYMSVSCNDKIIHEDNIEVLSSKLIRLTEEEQSFQNLNIEMKFDTPFESLDPFISLYNDTELENVIRETFRVYDYSRSYLTTPSKEDSDTIYESFSYYVDKNHKTPNPIRTTNYLRFKYDLYVDAYFNWFISDRSNHIWNPVGDIPQEVIKEISIYRDERSVRDYGYLNMRDMRVILDFIYTNQIELTQNGVSVDDVHALTDYLNTTNETLYPEVYSDSFISILRYIDDRDDLEANVDDDNAILDLIRYVSGTVRFTTYDVIYDLGRTILLSDKWLDDTKYVGLRRSDAIEFVAEYLTENGISALELEGDYDSHIISNTLHRRDLLAIDPTVFFDGENIPLGS